MLPNWVPNSPKWSGEALKLLTSTKNDDGPSPVNLPIILEKSESCARPFPIDSNRCKTLKNVVSEEVLTRNANSAYPIVHENALSLYASFILHKRLYGNSIEKDVYNSMDLLQLVDRFLTKRAVTFTGKRDNFSLLNGKKGHSAWETIGTSKEKEPTKLRNCISYEEIKLSAFLSVSSYTYFVNIGDRKNFGVYSADRSDIQEEGVIIGIIGPRLVKKDVMDYQELIVTETQNTSSNGYGKISLPTIHHLFAQLYDEECLDYKEIIENKRKLPANVNRYTELKSGEILDNFVYYKRLIFTLDTLFFEANHRAQQKATTAYVHVVGIGLGLWKKSVYQNKVFMDTCAQRIVQLGKHLPHISDICFAYIKHDFCGKYKHGDKIPIPEHPLNGIKIYLYKREPHERLKGQNEGKLLVVSYAWDGNALPGNEFWNKKLGSSGDSAAASSTQISELHNPFINPKVCARNLQVVTSDGVISFKQYVKRIVSKTKKESTGETSIDSSSTSTDNIKGKYFDKKDTSSKRKEQYHSEKRESTSKSKDHHRSDGKSSSSKSKDDRHSEKKDRTSKERQHHRSEKKDSTSKTKNVHQRTSHDKEHHHSKEVSTSKEEEHHHSKNKGSISKEIEQSHQSEEASKRKYDSDSEGKESNEKKIKISDIIS